MLKEEDGPVPDDRFVLWNTCKSHKTTFQSGRNSGYIFDKAQMSIPSNLYKLRLFPGCSSTEALHRRKIWQPLASRPEP